MEPPRPRHVAPPSAVLLCAGFATRLGELGRQRPKALLRVADRPLIDYLVRQLLGLEGLREIHLVANSTFRGQFERWAAGWSEELGSAKVTLTVHDNGRTKAAARRGAVGDLAFVLERLAPPRPTLVCGTDNLYLFPLAPLWQAALADRRHRVLAVLDHDPASIRGSAVLELAADGRVLDVLEKPSVRPPRQACPALYFLQSTAFDEPRRFLAAGGSPDELGRFLAFLAGRQDVVGHAVEGRRLHVTTAADRTRAERILARAASADPPAAGSETPRLDGSTPV